jgi:hypothetical protein
MTHPGDPVLGLMISGTGLAGTLALYFSAASDEMRTICLFFVIVGAMSFGFALGNLYMKYWMERHK